jgi:pimeloyl-ACP methyl ester carboxylesterase
MMIHLLKAILIGGSMQYVSIHGTDSTKPILLMLHGGPGMAQIGVARHFSKQLEENFVVVNWDQRGAGKSYSKNVSPQSMTTNQFVQDAIEVSEYLCKTYNRKNIYICGHSWGSAIGIMAAHERPDLYKAFIGVGQVVNIVQGQQLSYEFVLKNATAANDVKSLAKLQKLGTAPYTDIQKLQSLVGMIEQYNGSVFNGKINTLVKKGASTKEYNIWDWVWRFNKGIKFSLKHLLPHTLQIDVAKQINELKIPVYFIMGENDQQTPLSLVQQYYDSLKAPKKNLFVIDKCAHMLPFEKPEELAKLLMEIEKENR